MDFPELTFTGAADPADIARALSSTGCALVKGCFDAAKLDQLEPLLEAHFAALDAQKQSGQLPLEKSFYYKFGTSVMPEVLAGRLETIAEFLTGSAYIAAARQYFGAHELLMEPHRLAVRRQRAGYAPPNIPYHQDAYTRTPGIIGTINCWVPFNACGIDSPALEVVPVKLNRVLPTRPRPLLPENEAFDLIHITRDTIVQECGDGHFWAPQYERGDAMIFAEDVVHRTYVTPAMTRDRVSIELRTFSRDCIKGETPAEPGRIVVLS